MRESLRILSFVNFSLNILRNIIFYNDVRRGEIPFLVSFLMLFVSNLDGATETKEEDLSTKKDVVSTIGVSADGSASISVSGNVITTTYIGGIHHHYPPDCRARVIDLPDRNDRFMKERKPTESVLSYLELIHQRLFHDKELTLTGSGLAKIAVSGMGGVGKTQLALAYAWEAVDKRDYHLVWWIYSETEERLLDSYRSLVKRLTREPKSDIELVGYLRQELLGRSELCKKPWLLIYDNAPSEVFLRNRVPQAGGHILITSRDREWKVNPLYVDVFQPHEAINYLFQETKREDSEENRAGAQRVAKMLGYLPLALSHAASYMREKRLRFEAYEQAFQEKTAQLLSYLPENGEYPLVVGATWQVTIEALSEGACEFLRYLYYLESDRIPLELMKRLAGTQEEELGEIIRELERYSLINIKSKENKEEVSIHRLVQLVGRLEFERKSSDVYKSKIQEILLNILECQTLLLFSLAKEKTITMETSRADVHEDYGCISLLSPHIQKIEKHLKRLQKELLFDAEWILSTQILCCCLKKEVEERMYNLFSILILEEEEEREKRVSEDQNNFIEQQIEGLSGDNAYALNINEYKTLVKQISPLLRGELSKKEISSILDLVVPINSEKRQFLINQSQKFLTSKVFVNGWDRSRIITLISQMQDFQDENYIICVQNLITGDIDGTERAALMELFLEINPLQREDVFLNAQKIVNNNTSGWERSSIIELIYKKMDSLQRKSITDYVQTLMTNDMTGQECFKLIKLAAQMDISQRENCFIAIKRLIEGLLDKDDRIRIIDWMIQIDLLQKEKMFKMAQSRISDKMDGKERIKILEEIIPEELISYGDSDWSEFNPSWEEKTVGTMLSQVEEPRREDFIENIQHIFKEIGDPVERVQLFQQIHDINPLQRENVLTHCCKLILSNMKYGERRDIIEAVLSIHLSKREEVIMHVKGLVADDTRGREITRIIELVLSIDPQEMNILHDNIKEIFIKNKEELDRLKIMELILKAAPFERKNILVYTQDLIPKRVDSKNSSKILQAIFQIPPLQREPIVQYAQEIIKNHMDCEERAKIIEAIYKVDFLERKGVLVNFQTLYFNILEEMDGWKCAQIIETIAEITSTEERQRIISSIQRAWQQIKGKEGLVFLLRKVGCYKTIQIVKDGSFF